MLDLNTGLSAPVSQRPRAIAKEKDGVVLYWVEELGVAGLHQRGLASLLEYDSGSLGKLVKGVEGLTFLEAEIITESGLRSVDLILESDLSEVLVEIVSSKIKQETRYRAKAILKKLAAAGFKLMVMLELAPAELAARAVSHLDKEIELERLRNEGKAIDAQRAVLEDKTLSFRHYVTTALPKATADRILGTPEVQPEIKTRTVVIDQFGGVVNAGDTLSKTQLCQELGFINAKGKAETKQVAALVDEAIQAGAIPIPWRDERTVIATGFDAELLPKLKAYYQASPVQRQKWLGEN